MELSETKKAAMVATGLKLGLPLVAIGIGAFALKRMFGRNPDGTSTGAPPSMKATVIKRENLSITPSDAALYANTLYGAMQNFGTDEKTIYNTIDKLRSKDDLLLVIKAFGMKKYFVGAREPMFGQEYNLIGWLRQELNENEIARIKPKFDQWGIPI